MTANDSTQRRTGSRLSPPTRDRLDLLVTAALDAAADRRQALLLSAAVHLDEDPSYVAAVAADNTAREAVRDALAQLVDWNLIDG